MRWDVYTHYYPETFFRLIDHPLPRVDRIFTGTAHAILNSV